MKIILDVSNLLYGGHNGNPMALKGFPIGGIRKILGLINSNLSQADFLLCFDGSNLLKKELLPTYKAGRVPDYSVYAQANLLKEILLDCNIPYYISDGVEADDYIYSLCKTFCEIGDIDNITIYSDDHDLACCVSDKVSIRNVTSNGVCINMENYETRVVTGEKIPYNTIILYKLLFGDKSDNYKALNISGLRFDTLHEKFKSAIDPLIEEGVLTSYSYADIDAFNIIIEGLANEFSSSEMKKIKEQAVIAFPRNVDVFTSSREALIDEVNSGTMVYEAQPKHMKITNNTTLNRKKFDFYCTIMKLNRTRLQKYVDMESKEAQEFLNKLTLMAKDLSGGVMAVEFYKNKKHVVPVGEPIADMELPI